MFKPSALAVVFVVVGCAKGTGAPNGTPTSTAATTTPRLACDASNAPVYETAGPKPGWNVVGHLEITVAAGGDVTKLDVKDASNALVDSTPIHERLSNKEALLPAVSAAVCRARGDVGVMDERARTETRRAMESGGVVVLDVMSPASENETADVEHLCQAPSNHKPSGRALSDYAMAHDEIGWLTSRRWRGWLFATEDKLGKTSHDEQHRVAAARADELEQMTKRPNACWYATILRAL